MLNLSAIQQIKKSYVYYNIGTIVTYSVIITNNEKFPVTDIKLTNVLGKNQSFMTGSIILNGERPDTTDLDTGINIEKLPAGKSIFLDFDILVENDNLYNPIENHTIVSYSDKDGNTQEILSNKPILSPIQLDFFADKQDVNIGNILKFTVTINNHGNDTLNKIRVYDTFPKELILLPGTVTVNNTPIILDLNSNILLDTLPSNSTVIITFQAQVISYPSNGIIENKIYIYYETISVINGTSYKSVGGLFATPYKVNLIN